MAQRLQKNASDRRPRVGRSACGFTAMARLYPAFRPACAPGGATPNALQLSRLRSRVASGTPRWRKRCAPRAAAGALCLPRQPKASQRVALAPLAALGAKVAAVEAPMGPRRTVRTTAPTLAVGAHEKPNRRRPRLASGERETAATSPRASGGRGNPRCGTTVPRWAPYLGRAPRRGGRPPRGRWRRRGPKQVASQRETPLSRAGRWETRAPC
mmetsp:Transcript_92548/g.261436  ORF Transcript_92548/g.261436 Transcript_92548/m.261436 type:complete len:213 (-) Transcript_92548:1026-1664(-)